MNDKIRQLLGQISALEDKLRTALHARDAHFPDYCDAADCHAKLEGFRLELAGGSDCPAP